MLTSVIILVHSAIFDSTVTAEIHNGRRIVIILRLRLDRSGFSLAQQDRARYLDRTRRLGTRGVHVAKDVFGNSLCISTFITSQTSKQILHILSPNQGRNLSDCCHTQLPFPLVILRVSSRPRQGTRATASLMMIIAHSTSTNISAASICISRNLPSTENHSLRCSLTGAML